MHGTARLLQFVSQGAERRGEIPMFLQQNNWFRMYGIYTEVLSDEKSSRIDYQRKEAECSKEIKYMYVKIRSPNIQTL